MSLAEEIARLHELLGRGAITAEGDRWIGGVCGGIGRLTGVESWIWRMLFVAGLIFGGFTFFAYVVLWIFIPREGR